LKKGSNSATWTTGRGAKGARQGMFSRGEEVPGGGESGKQAVTPRRLTGRAVQRALIGVVTIALGEKDDEQRSPVRGKCLPSIKSTKRERDRATYLKLYARPLGRGVTAARNTTANVTGIKNDRAFFVQGIPAAIEGKGSEKKKRGASQEGLWKTGACLTVRTGGNEGSKSGDEGKKHRKTEANFEVSPTLAFTQNNRIIHPGDKEGGREK